MEKLRDIREKRFISQEDLAKISGKRDSLAKRI